MFRVCFFFVFILLVWRYSPTWAFAPSILRPQASLFSADHIQFLHFSILLSSLSTASYHLPLGLPTGLLSPMYPFGASWEPFHPSSPSHGPPTGTFSILYSWLTTFTCISYKFRNCTCFLTIYLQTRFQKRFLELFSQVHEAFIYLFIYFAICDNVRASPITVRKTLLVFNTIICWFS